MELVQGVSSASVFPHDVWGVILKSLYTIDTIFLRATNSTLYKICKQFLPFPKHHVLDQHKLVAYLAQNGFISLLDYAKDTLHFEWIPVLSLIAARSGQVEVLKCLVNSGLAIDKSDFMIECTKHSCDLSMIKYLHENGVPWDQHFIAEDQTGPTTVMGWMFHHGHLDCIKYAMENGCTQRHIQYTPSIECLDFAIQNGFDWKGETQTQKNRFGRTERKKNICEEAARLGDLAMLKHAHEKGVPLRYSAPIANQEGHVECLMYAYEQSSENPHPTVTKSFDCFQYLVQKLGLEVMRGMSDLWFSHLHGGQLETLRFMHQNNFPFRISSPFMTKVALERSLHSIDIFKFMLDEVKAPYDIINPYIASAEHGNLECLELCFERNLPNKPPAELPGNDGAFILMPSTPEPLIQTLIAAAINSKNVDVLELLWKKFPNKEGLDMELCLKMAARDSVPEVLEFLTQQGAQWTPDHLAWTTVSESLPNMAYLTRIGCKWNDEECKSENSMIVKYAREHGCKHFYNEEYKGTPNKIQKTQ